MTHTPAHQTAQTDLVIDAHGLTKKFGAFAALDTFNLQVGQGQVHGFLGPNGAGKSTTIRVLLGLLQKTSGQVTVFGQDPWSDSVELHKRLSYVPGDVNLWDGLTGGEVIDLFGNLRGGLQRKRRDALLRDFQLDPRKKCGTYSKGNRQKVALVAALAADVDLYILDEPTSGLDPLMETVFQEYITELKRAGKTVLLSSHILAEVEVLADHITIIRNGQTVETGKLSELRHLGWQTVAATLGKKPVKLTKMAGVNDVVLDGNHVTFAVDHEYLSAVMSYLADLGIHKLITQHQSLEDLFIKHYDTGKPAGLGG